MAPDGPVIACGPDAAFAFDLRDEQRASAYLDVHPLEDGMFLVVIPRLRFTPYHEIHHYEPNEWAKAQMDGETLEIVRIHGVGGEGDRIVDGHLAPAVMLGHHDIPDETAGFPQEERTGQTA